MGSVPEGAPEVAAAAGALADERATIGVATAAPQKMTAAMAALAVRAVMYLVMFYFPSLLFAPSAVSLTTFGVRSHSLPSTYCGDPSEVYRPRKACG